MLSDLRTPKNDNFTNIILILRQNICICRPSSLQSAEIVTESLMRLISYENSTNYQRCHEKFFRRSYATQIVRTVHQFTFWVIKVNMDEMREVRISKHLETDNKGYREENE